MNKLHTKSDCCNTTGVLERKIFDREWSDYISIGGENVFAIVNTFFRGVQLGWGQHFQSATMSSVSSSVGIHHLQRIQAAIHFISNCQPLLSSVLHSHTAILNKWRDWSSSNAASCCCTSIGTFRAICHFTVMYRNSPNIILL